MTAVDACALTSLLLEDAVVSTVEFCCDEATSELPLTTWLRFFWAVWRSVTVLGAVGVGRAVSRFGLCCRKKVTIVGLHDVTEPEQQRAEFRCLHVFMQFICILHKATSALLSDCKNEGEKYFKKKKRMRNIC